MSITESPAFRQGLAEGRAENRKIEPISETMRRWEAERYLCRTDPRLAALLRIEAIADDRAENQQCAASKLVVIRDLVRDLVAAETGKPFKNPIFP